MSPCSDFKTRRNFPSSSLLCGCGILFCFPRRAALPFVVFLRTKTLPFFPPLLGNLVLLFSGIPSLLSRSKSHPSDAGPVKNIPQLTILSKFASRVSFRRTSFVSLFPDRTYTLSFKVNSFFRRRLYHPPQLLLHLFLLFDLQTAPLLPVHPIRDRLFLEGIFFPLASSSFILSIF